MRHLEGSVEGMRDAEVNLMARSGERGFLVLNPGFCTIGKGLLSDNLGFRNNIFINEL